MPRPCLAPTYSEKIAPTTAYVMAIRNPAKKPWAGKAPAKNPKSSGPKPKSTGKSTGKPNRKSPAKETH